MTYYSFNDYCRERFGCKVYKLSLDAGFTCPNRDGTLATGGCIFCSGGSGGRFAASGTDISAQLEQAKVLVAQKGAKKFIAYFQAFTNTYAPIERLRELYYAAIESEDIVALDIATRPDCLNDDVLALLREINRIKPVMVELGLQTANESTAVRIHRCYDNRVYVQAVQKLKQCGIHTVTHLIFGFPWESEEEMLRSVKFARDAGTAGVKFHMLNVLRGTELAELYQNEAFEMLSLEEYTGIVVKALSLLPRHVVVHRLTGDGDKRALLAPQWVKDKKKVLNYMHRAIQVHEINIK